MDTLRGNFYPESAVDRSWDASADDGPEPAPQPTPARELPPQAIGQDERRMQVRAYNHWASLLAERMYPLIDDLDPANLPDFGPHSVLLDFSYGIENPAVRFIGDKLARECGAHGEITRLSDVPRRSLLSRITDHYMQILANQAPIGFEAEFVNHAGSAILYRGILLPFSSNGETIDFICGVINWKQMADQLTTEELLLELDQVLELGSELEMVAEAPSRTVDPVTDWADSPAHENVADGSFGGAFGEPVGLEAAAADDPAMSDFGQYALDDDDEDYDENEGEAPRPGSNFASLADYTDTPAKKVIDLTQLTAWPYGQDADEPDHSLTALSSAPRASFGRSQVVPHVADDLADDPGLYDCLAAARELARAADTTEDRSRTALYAAVSRAYDFSLAAQAAPQDYAELIADAGLTVQDRAPMTPVVKLVFGHDYDKTRLTEYAAVLTHAHRLELEPGALAGFLAATEGGVKAVVKAER
ncbi:MAG: hypothetical protein ACKO1N_08710, partial [Erythrobacter sp.]